MVVPSHAWINRRNSDSIRSIMSRYNTNKPQSLGDALDEVIERLGLEDKIDETNVIETWAELAGAKVNAVTKSVWMKNGKLFVKVTSPAWRHELHLSRSDWCSRLNDRLEKPIVDEIVFR